MRVAIVCGSRSGTINPRQEMILKDMLIPMDIVILGQASGIDKRAGDVAEKLGKQRIEVPAAWHKPWMNVVDVTAGPRRNRLMADLAEMLMEGAPQEDMFEDRPVPVLIAFPGGSGTSGMVRIAEDRGFKIERIP